MKKKITISKRKQNERNQRIMSLYKTHADDFSSKLDLYLYIAEKVGCSHITVYKVLKNGN